MLTATIWPVVGHTIKFVITYEFPYIIMKSMAYFKTGSVTF